MTNGDLVQEKIDAATEKVQLSTLIDIYTNLQRIKSSTDRDKEINYQIEVTKAKLEGFGIAAKDLDIC